jgi:phenylacetic acid degradation protein paaN
MLSHSETLQRATEACRTRQHWSAFHETPSTKLHGEEAPKLGLQAFEQQLGRPFELEQPGEAGRLGKEISPYTQQALGIDYPAIDVDVVCQAALKAMRQWQKVDPDTRALIGVEMLRALEAQLFENSHATLHTAGQSFMMGFVGSGANALDRGLEALVYAHKAMTDLPQTALWQKPFGSHTVALEKRYHFVPRGIALVICCASFPAWNAYPAIMANLITGNPVVLKPHPGGILPMAISVRALRRVLDQHGIDPNLITMAADTRDEPIAGQFLQRADVGIVDFTGSQRFGSWLEQNVHNKRVYTETSGVNSVVIESTSDLDGMVDAIAHSLCLFSAQMCTSPQNIHLPRGGIESDQGHVSAAEVAERILARVEDRASNPAKAAAICGALQSDATLHLLDDLARKAGTVGRVLRASGPYQHPEYPNARTATPLIIAADKPDHELLQDEHFGPASFIITHDSADAALASAAATALKCGAIATHVYSSNKEFQGQAEEAFVAAGASTTFNLSGPMPLNYAAAYSDLHVTGLNPAGNACLTDLAFVCDRFRIVQARWPAGTR